MRTPLAGQFGRLTLIVAWLLPAAAAAIDELRHGCVVGGDTGLFVRAGSTLLSAHWSHAFASPTVQVGPLQLALFGPWSPVSPAPADTLRTRCFRWSGFSPPQPPAAVR